MGCQARVRRAAGGDVVSESLTVHAPDPVVAGISRCGVTLPPEASYMVGAALPAGRGRQCRRRGCAAFWDAWNAGMDEGIADRRGEGMRG